MYFKDPVLFHTIQRGTLLDISQVMILHTLICKIYVLRLTTLVCDELVYSFHCTQILAFLTMKLETHVSSVVRIPIYLRPKSFVFVFLGEKLMNENTKSRPSFSILFDGNWRHFFGFSGGKTQKSKDFFRLWSRVFAKTRGKEKSPGSRRGPVGVRQKLFVGRCVQARCTRNTGGQGV